MNAAEQATNLRAASKIASVVGLFKAKFQDVRSDLKPWMNDPDTRDLVDPDSIDIGFHFPGRSRRFQSRSILVQIRLADDPVHPEECRAIGVELAGFDHTGKQWQLSTIGQWDFEGKTCPAEEAAHELKSFCRQVLEIFDGS
ncbi:hypothetical protein BST81_05695 [Leptolyngbya sp. 'hensonii']|uniref:hypothetical protein n=1 Tax=Leptolyngbya sp. 'hensonii' TaxID=1922337 RepID=UPI00094FCA2F|nr:hypothetical protein [Leptolyngbya sp. 'hensonii']OLP19254.1 hypothetical protein BST81_05695 [Leptolyngbya sp. 'hensonii']